MLALCQAVCQQCTSHALSHESLSIAPRATHYPHFTVKKTEGREVLKIIELVRTEAQLTDQVSLSSSRPTTCHCYIDISLRLCSQAQVWVHTVEGLKYQGDVWAALHGSGGIPRDSGAAHPLSLIQEALTEMPATFQASRSRMAKTVSPSAPVETEQGNQHSSKGVRYRESHIPALRCWWSLSRAGM